KPRRMKGHQDWECPFRIKGAGVARLEFGYGVDALQALTTALKEYARCSMRLASRSLGVECSPTTRAFQGTFQLARGLNFRRDSSAWLIVNSIVTCVSWNEDIRSDCRRLAHQRRGRAAIRS